ncbi:hypothetical protein TPHA_0J01500 [Tetrapisispora phaffii CBS 4417]|uniref:Uncharacterized protein n=1 Tax=Tetrapisispora phaffii (strain ATCC 24235 / CBS 4417 / NBRC 1672 / NRRL Y-8282 / UCD 70-5) TaxID=1071381 RepID=G8BYM9_TETPH|nr:mitochondrial 54S ribosomal protein YmL20 TPHA_0J01500 [Tetrapisispora phaffii CBS 4417]CCE64971.1 hypothetical protein TPHA_0J01500 [Tetrapisispora phaffii CBS 4417]
MQRFTRAFNSSSSHLKDLSRFIDKSKNIVINETTKIPTLKGSPTIYNPKSSASNYKGYLRANIQPGLYFNKAQSSPTGSINIETYPPMFLSKDDPRANVIKQVAENDPLAVKNIEDAPPVLISKSTSNSKDKRYHLKPEQIQEIIELRNANPEKYTRKALAAQFQVSPLFISMVASAPMERRLEMQSRLVIIKSKWHMKKAIARADRSKRSKLKYRA